MSNEPEVYLIAQGEDAAERWRRPLPIHTTVCLGRMAGLWSVPWDPHISRQHAEICWDGRSLRVRRLPSARNPIYFQGKENDEFHLNPGDCFVIGKTSFIVSRQRVSVAADHPTPTQQKAFGSQYLRQIAFRNPNYRLEVLSRLPRVVSRAAADAELAARLVNLLLAGMQNVEAVAIVALDKPYPADSSTEDDETQKGPQSEVGIHVVHWDRRQLTEGDFRPSRRLIVDAWRRRQSVLHLWREGTIEKPPKSGRPSSSPGQTTHSEPSHAHYGQTYTARQNIDWAIGTPILAEGASPWVLYVAGRFHSEWGSGATTPDSLQEDAKFLELVAEMTGALLQLRRLEHRQAVLSQFLPKPVMDRLGPEDWETALRPREVVATVLFCDLRGFAHETERQADQLLPLLDRISAALDVMTRRILEYGGVIGDFQGDAAMGFWGWPLPQEDRVAAACRAALAIRRDFSQAAQTPGHPLAGFQIGIGVASGRAVAGKIGTADHAKITVFGPPANLAARLEGITKLLHVPILMDDETARTARDVIGPDIGRIRPIARIRPYGLDQPVLVHELLPSESEYPILRDQHLRLCEQAVEAFIAGRWEEAFTMLHQLPAEDRGPDFLMAYIAQHHRIPPTPWDGTIIISSK